MRAWLIENWSVVALLLVFAVGTVIIALAPATVVVAAKEPVEPCELWGHAGAVPVFRCVDEDNYIVCYSQSPMLFCLEQP